MKSYMEQYACESWNIVFVFKLKPSKFGVQMDQNFPY